MKKLIIAVFSLFFVISFSTQTLGCELDTEQMKNLLQEECNKFFPDNPISIDKFEFKGTSYNITETYKETEIYATDYTGISVRWSWESGMVGGFDGTITLNQEEERRKGIIKALMREVSMDRYAQNKVILQRFIEKAVPGTKVVMLENGTFKKGRLDKLGYERGIIFSTDITLRWPDGQEVKHRIMGVIPGHAVNPHEESFSQVAKSVEILYKKYK